MLLNVFMSKRRRLNLQIQALAWLKTGNIDDLKPSCSVLAANFGKKVAVLDYVDPSAQGKPVKIGGLVV